MAATLTPPKPRRRTPAKQVLRPSLGAEVCDWIEAYLCHGPGDIQGDPIVLDDEFRAFIWRAYEIYPKGHPREGRRAFYRAFLSRPKGRAKSELASMITCVEALGPSRFDGWGRGGVPRARPVVAPLARCFATEESQAGNTYEGVYYMLSEGPIASDREFEGLDVGLTRTNLPDGGVIKAVTSAAGSKDGGKDTFNVFDETHLWTTPELRRLHDTVTRNLGKRMLSNGWSLETSTMYGLGEGSVAETTHALARLSKDSGLLFDHREAPPDVDLEDDEQILAALRHVYGVAAEWMDLEGLLEREFHDPAKTEADNRRYWFNQPVKLAGRMVDPNTLRSMEAVGRVVKPRTKVVLGFDGSKNRDATALLGWTVEEVPHLFVLHIWERPANASADWRVPRLEVDAQVKRAFDRFDVARMVCDPAYWDTEIEEWAIEFGEDTVIAFDTNQPSRMGPACRRFKMALTERSFTWDGDEVLRSHMHHMDTKDTRWGPLVVKPDGKQSEKIDGGVAAIIGYAELLHIPLGGGMAREWLEAMGATPASPAADAPESPSEPAEPEPQAEAEARWTPWGPVPQQKMADQTQAALNMLRNLPGARGY